MGESTFMKQTGIGQIRIFGPFRRNLSRKNGSGVKNWWINIEKIFKCKN
jgi:hypothetical protein